MAERRYLGQYSDLESWFPITQLTTAPMLMKSSLSKTGAAFLLVSFGAACGISNAASSTELGGSTDPGSDTNGGNTADGGGNTTNGGDRGNTADGGGNTTDGGGESSADGGGNTPAVNLRTARAFAILSKGGISTVPTAAIKGNLGVSPAAATYITGFALSADASNVFSTSTQVTGKVYAADYALPTPTNLTAAIGDMELAFTEAAGRAPDFIEFGAGDIGGATLNPGIYKWATGVLIPTSVSLSGGANDVWIFQIAQTLTMSTGTSIVLKGGAVPKNIFWQIAGSVELGTGAHFEGNILTQTSVTLGTGASIKGSLLAQTTVDLAAGTVVELAP